MWRKLTHFFSSEQTILSRVLSFVKTLRKHATLHYFACGQVHEGPTHKQETLSAVGPKISIHNQTAYPQTSEEEKADGLKYHLHS